MGEFFTGLFCICIFILIFADDSSVKEKEMQKKAIAAGVGCYNPTNGNFEWKTNNVK